MVIKARAEMRLSAIVIINPVFTTEIICELFQNRLAHTYPLEIPFLFVNLNQAAFNLTNVRIHKSVNDAFSTKETFSPKHWLTWWVNIVASFDSRIMVTFKYFNILCYSVYVLYINIHSFSLSTNSLLIVNIKSTSFICLLMYMIS